MLLHIPGIFNSKEVACLRQTLKGTEWTDGRIGTHLPVPQAQHNLQLPESHPLAREIGEIMLQRIWHNPRFMSAVLPRKIFPPQFNCYTQGGRFNLHIDTAVRQLFDSLEQLRTDVSSTLFLSDPDEYDGGELEIQDSYSTQRVKLAAGDLIVYPASSLHKVEPVTRGTRYAAFFWTQSLVRDDRQRALLFQMDEAIQQLAQDVPAHPSLLQLTGSYHNLLRQWADA